MADSNITKNALAMSLKELMAEKPFEKISISDICESCGMNRKSFYYHFKDKYDLVNWIFYVNCMSKLNLDEYDTGWDMISAMCDMFYEDKEFYLEALKIEGQNSFHDYVLETLRPLTQFFIEDILKGESQREFFFTFVTDAFLMSIMRWLSEGMIMPKEEFMGNLHEVALKLAYKVINDEEKITDRNS
jgi:probable dihydroxyacetone kinase regulator